MKKFDRVKIESNTKIHLIDYININSFDCRHEIWSWDGIKGESLIFCTKDFKNHLRVDLRFPLCLGAVACFLANH